MPAARKILMISNNAAERQAMAKNLETAGYNVIQEQDGALAINKAILDPPDMIVSAADMPMVDGFKLCQLLRTNPATEQIPFIFITGKETNPKRLGQFIRPDDDFILRPFRVEELLGRVNNLFYRLGKVQEVSEEADRSVAGTLTEIALVDLLQIFKMNQKSGILTLKVDGQSGLIFIRKGVVVNARIGRVSGQKAIFRLITWQHGTFEFKPSYVTTEVKIHEPTENLIMEGLRQLDELTRMKGKLPPKKAFLKVKKRFKGHPEKLKPVTREVLRLLDHFKGIEEILDNSSFPDLEVYSALRSLLEQEVVEISEESQPVHSQAAAPILSLEEVLKIGYYLGVGQGEISKLWTGKLLICAQNQEYLYMFLENAKTIPEVKPEDEDENIDRQGISGTGIKASMTIMDKINLLLFNIPCSTGFEPLWRAFYNGSIGALILGNGDKEGDKYFGPVTDFLKEVKIPFSCVSLDNHEQNKEGHGTGNASGIIQWVSLDKSDNNLARKALRSLFETIISY